MLQSTTTTTTTTAKAVATSAASNTTFVSANYLSAPTTSSSSTSSTSSTAGPLELELEINLVQRAYRRDFEAVELLYQHYNRQAFGLAMRMLNNHHSAEDAVQDAFLRFWKKPTNYNPAGGARFVTWLLTVVRNVCRDYLRKSSRVVFSLDHNWQTAHKPESRVSALALTTRSATPTPTLSQPSCTASSATRGILTQQSLVDPSPPVEEEVWLGLQQDIIRQALTTLPTNQKLLIETAFFKGCTYQQIADQMGIPLGTVKSTIRRGLLNLRSTEEVAALKLTHSVA